MGNNVSRYTRGVLNVMFPKKQFISREIWKRGEPWDTGDLIYVKPFGGIAYAVLLQPRSNLQLSNVPGSPGDLAVFFSLMIVVDSRAVFPHRM